MTGRALIAGAIVLVTAATAHAETTTREVAIGLAAAPASFDPHFLAHTPSSMVQRHVFEPLVARDDRSRVVAALAESWMMLPDGAGWEFRLDPRATFSDGQPVTPSDVVATIARLPTVPNSPSRLTTSTTQVRAVEDAGSGIVRLLTHGPAPTLPQTLTTLYIVPARIAQEATTADFNAGRAAIGSGPYRLLHYAQGERVVVERNPAWRDEPPSFGRVTFRVIANDAARIAALRAGDVQMIEAVPTAELADTERNPTLVLWRNSGARFIFVSLDVARDVSPGITDLQGRVLDRNPLLDVRVRRALSLGMDRVAIQGRIMQGASLPAGQFQPIGTGVADPDLAADPHDPARARALLAEAGWPDGFRLTLAGASDRYVNDDKILQAIAQQWERIGVRVRVEAMPNSVFVTRFSQRAFSAALAGWQSTLHEPNLYVVSLLLTADRARGLGAMNPHGYSNPVLDALYQRTIVNPSAEERAAGWREMVRMAMADLPILPVHHEIGTWATHRGLIYTPRADSHTLAMGLRPAP